MPRPTSELELRIVDCQAFAVDSQGASRAREMEALSRLLSEATLLLRTSGASARRGWYGRWMMRLCRARYGYVIAAARATKLICSLDLSKFHGSKLRTHVSLVTSSRLCFVAIARSMCQNVRLRPRVLLICLSTDCYMIHSRFISAVSSTPSVQSCLGPLLGFNQGSIWLCRGARLASELTADARSGSAATIATNTNHPRRPCIATRALGPPVASIK